MHEYLKYCFGYVAGEYFEDISSGEYKEGVLCIDLCNIPFAENSFDLVISEDVFEPIVDYKKAFREIYRVLKNGGKHIFAIPLHEGRKTISRLDNRNKVCYGDPIRPNAILLRY